MTSSQMQRHAFSGHLFTSSSRSVRVSISHTADGILLTVVGDPGDLFDQPLTDLTLESTGGQGVLRTPGTGQRVDHNQVRFFLDDTADVVQRRQFVRVAVAQRVVLHDDEGEQVADTYAVNISGGGMLVALPRKLQIEPDATVSFVLYLRAEEEPVAGTGRVIRVNEADQQLALAFEEISRRERERVIKFVFDRQRAAIAMTRGDAT